MRVNTSTSDEELSSSPEFDALQARRTFKKDAQRPDAS